MQRYTIEWVRQYLNSIGYKLISEEFLSIKQNLIIEDELGYLYYKNLDRLLVDLNTKKFHTSNPYTIYNIILWLKLNKPYLKLISNEYKGINTPLLFMDNNGYYYPNSLRSIIEYNNLSIICEKSNFYTIYNIKLWCKLNNKPFELISEEYNGNKEKLKWQCLKSDCGEIFEMNWANISHGKNCPFCAGQKTGISNCLATKNPDLAKEWHPTKNGDLTPYDVTCGRSDDVWWKCKECGHEWEARVASRNTGNGCPECHESKGEKKIKEWLKLHNKYYIREFIFCDLLSDLNNPLRFDFAIFNDKENNNLKMLIEFDGKQHFEWVPHLMSYNGFLRLQTHDELKNQYCKINNINLIRIPYWDYNNIEKILELELKL